MQIPVTKLYDALETYLHMMVYVKARTYACNLFSIRMNTNTNIMLLDIDNANASWLSLGKPWSVPDMSLPELTQYVHLYAK